MTPLTFVDTHNMVAFLSTSDASDGFDQIVDFLNAYTIKYALMLNPTIHVSCIKQFWATATVEKVNGDVQLQALIYEKKVVVTEAIIRRDLYLDDANGAKCLPNAEIFEELARMGYEKPPHKLTFYNSMASAVICLATGRKFNFSKYIFNNMVRNVDSLRREGGIAAIDADEGITLVDIETDEEEVALDAKSQGNWRDLPTDILLVSVEVLRILKDGGEGDSDGDSVGSDLYKGEEDRRRLVKMSELNIEMMLADSLNKRNDKDLKNNIKKHKEKSNHSRKDSSTPYTANWTMRSSARTADTVKAKDEQLNE
nr:protein RTF1 homolog [Tanacetum cinerariifolium]